MTRKLTWTFGVRDTFNSNPLNPHDEIARLRGSFASISHDVNQPLNAAIQTGLGNVFASTPLAILQPRMAIAWQFEPKTVLRTGFGIFSDILPGSVADLVGINPPYVQTFQGGLLGTVGGTAIRAGSAQQRRRRYRCRESEIRFRISHGRAFLRFSAGKSRNLSSASRDHSRPGWQTPRALLHGMEPGSRASIRRPTPVSTRNMSARAL